MPLLSTISDDFNDNTVGAIWTNNYGGASETGGRARVPCIAATFAGYQTAKSYTLAGSSVFLSIPTIPAASTATTATIVFGIIGATDGTNLQFTVNPVANTLRAESNVAYTDGAATSVTYNATNHLWMRYREDGTNVYWDTSANGISWTNLRTLATPAWVTAGVNTVGLDMYSNRDAGTTDFGEFDNLNISQVGSLPFRQTQLNQSVNRSILW